MREFVSFPLSVKIILKKHVCSLKKNRMREFVSFPLSVKIILKKHVCSLKKKQDEGVC